MLPDTLFTCIPINDVCTRAHIMHARKTGTRQGAQARGTTPMTHTEQKKWGGDGRRRLIGTQVTHVKKNQTMTWGFYLKSEKNRFESRLAFVCVCDSVLYLLLFAFFHCI